ncbi:MAG: ABC transporter substrate-binding protein [Synechococcales bacterium]|nr:ABC transporter substrate-binding protein [Synechococcales bacterium]
MAKQNDAPALIASLLLTLALLLGGGWWLMRQLGNRGVWTGLPDVPTGNVTSLPNASGTELHISGDRLSLGGIQLLAEEADPAKARAIAAIQSGDRATAIRELASYLQTNRNDPEALIYLNNAQIGDQPAHPIAVAVPAATAVNPAKELLRGVAQAQQEINESGGINGVPLRVLIASDDNEPAVASNLAQKLVEAQGILGVIGHFGSETTLATSPIYNEGKLVSISPTSTSVRLSSASDYVFRTVPSDRFTATTLSRHLINDLDLQNAALYFNAESDYSQSLNNEFTTSLYADGGQVVAEFNLADTGFDAVASVNQALQRGAEAIVLAANTATLDPALQVIVANDGRLALLGGDSLYNPKILEEGGAEAEGMVVAVPWILLANPQSEFVQTSRRMWGGDVNWRTAMAYDATLALAEAIAQSPTPVTREGIRQALAVADFAVEGATGTVSFLPSGDRNQTMQLVVVEPGTRSGYGYDFVPVE